MNQSLHCEIRHDACSNSFPVVSPAMGTGVRAPSTFNIFTSLRSKSDSRQSKYCVVCEISPFPSTDNVWVMMVVWMVGWTWWDWSLILYALFSFSVLMLLVELLVTYVLTSTSIVTVFIKRVLNPAIKSAVSAPRHNLQLWPLAINSGDATVPWCKMRRLNQ